MKIIGYIALSVLLLGMIAWGVLAIYYSYLPDPLRYGGAVLFPLVSSAVLLFVRPRRRGAVVFAGIFAVVLIGWFSMKPSNDRNWQPDVAVLPYATVKGDAITVHNIRNCDYRTETDYTVQYYDKTFDLSKLRSFDLFLSDWGLKIVVHTLVSFGFEDGSYLCISIETRKEVGEEYSTIKGFFRQYELFMWWRTSGISCDCGPTIGRGRPSICTACEAHPWKWSGKFFSIIYDISIG